MNSPESQKQLHLILYIVEKMGGECDFLTIFKMIYSADREHLATYGSLISGDKYVAMPFGPVPSNVYDILKVVRGDSMFSDLYAVYNDFLTVKGKYTVSAKIMPDVELFSEMEIECLDASISKNMGKDFDTLSVESHKSAWNAANLNSDMDLLKIAEEGNATPAMLSHIAESLYMDKLFA